MLRIRSQCYLGHPLVLLMWIILNISPSCVTGKVDVIIRELDFRPGISYTFSEWRKRGQSVHEYHIKTTDTDYKFIYITFPKFALGANDMLKIFDGSTSGADPPSTTYTGSPPHYYLSSGRYLTVVYKHNTSSIEPRTTKGRLTGFEAKFRVIKSSLSRSDFASSSNSPRGPPVRRFCGKMREVNATGYQFSPPEKAHAATTAFSVDCEWRLTAEKAPVFIALTFGTGAEFLSEMLKTLVFTATRGNSSADVRRISNYSVKHEVVSGERIAVLEIQQPDVTIKLEHQKWNTDKYFYFAYTTVGSMAARDLLLEVLEAESPVKRNDVFCPYKKCPALPDVCVWPWSNCQRFKTETQYEPDCDLYLKDADVKTCFPVDMRPEERAGKPRRCYRRSLEACDGYKDCSTGEDEKYYCSERKQLGVRSLRLRVGIVIPCTLVVMFGFCIVGFKCGVFSCMCKCMCDCLELCGCVKDCFVEDIWPTCIKPCTIIRRSCHRSSASEEDNQSVWESVTNLAPPTSVLMQRDRPPDYNNVSTGDDVTPMINDVTTVVDDVIEPPRYGRTPGVPAPSRGASLAGARGSPGNAPSSGVGEDAAPPSYDQVMTGGGRRGGEPGPPVRVPPAPSPAPLIFPRPSAYPSQLPPTHRSSIPSPAGSPTRDAGPAGDSGPPTYRSVSAATSPARSPSTALGPPAESGPPTYRSVTSSSSPAREPGPPTYGSLPSSPFRVPMTTEDEDDIPPPLVDSEAPPSYPSVW